MTFRSPERDQVDRENLLPEEVVALARRLVRSDTHVSIFLHVRVLSGRWSDVLIRGVNEYYGPCTVKLCPGELYPARVPLAVLVGPRSVAVDAAASALATQEDADDLFLRHCAPDASGRTVAGRSGELDHSDVAPIEGNATYHADATQVARDLALSWIFLHDVAFVHRVAALPLDGLAARVGAAPPGARVGVAREFVPLVEHLQADWSWPGRPEPKPPWDPVDQARKGPRVRLPGDVDLTREQVLAALATPPEKLLEALDACAVPDAEWRAIEPVAREVLKATRAGAPSEEVDVSTDDHTRWIEQHAPYHVRRLPSGGVMLATHPYRALWPLWAEALALLDIRKAT